MKELKDYIHLFVGNKVLTKHDALNNGEYQELTISINNLFEILYKYKESKLLLRPLQYAETDEIEQIIFLVMDSAVHLDADARFTIEEVRNCIESTEPDDNAIVVYFSVRCYSGTLYLSQHSGLVRLFNEEEKEEQIEFNPELYSYLLSRGFDLFDLIPAGLAIDKTKLHLNETH